MEKAAGGVNGECEWIAVTAWAGAIVWTRVTARTGAIAWTGTIAWTGAIGWTGAIATGICKWTGLTGGTNSSIYAFQFGEDGLCGLTGPGGLQVVPIGPMETKDATRTRIKWYVSLALFSTVKAAALIGVQD